MQVSGAGEALLISSFILSLIYFAFGFVVFNQIDLREAFKKGLMNFITVPELILGMVLGLSSSIGVTAIIFKLLLLSGSQAMLLIGAGMTVLSAIVGIIYTTVKDRKDSPLFTALFLKVVPLILILIGLSNISNENLFDFYYRNNPEEAQIQKEKLERRRAERDLQ